MDEFNDTDSTELTEGKIRRLKNLRLYKDKSEEEIRAIFREKQNLPPITSESKSEGKSERLYNQRFAEKFEVLKTEFGLDMNNSNDAEQIKNLVKQMIQAENTDSDIRFIQEKVHKTRDDVSLLKSLGDFQRDVQMTISDLQDKLGISRKMRKDKASDDIPQFIDALLLKAKTYWEKTTHSVECPNCQIELIRYWYNFPDLVSNAVFTVQCPHCEEKVVYNG